MLVAQGWTTEQIQLKLLWEVACDLRMAVQGIRMDMEKQQQQQQQLQHQQQQHAKAMKTMKVKKAMKSMKAMRTSRSGAMTTTAACKAVAESMGLTTKGVKAAIVGALLGLSAKKTKKNRCFTFKEPLSMKLQVKRATPARKGVNMLPMKKRKQMKS